jgi:small Trp-rich protein
MLWKKGGSMPLIFIIISLLLLRFFEVGPFATLSWWWIVAVMVFAFIWFEFIEKALGLDKRKAHDELEKARKDRVKKNFK